MPRKKRTPAPETAATPTAAAETQTAGAAVQTPQDDVRSAPDVFDQAIAARQSEQAMGDSPVPADGRETPSPDREEGTRRWQVQPDPHPFYSVSLTDANDGPRIRLYRSRKFNQVAVQFDEKPELPFRRRMHDEGYRWREAEGVWTKQLGEHRVSGQLAAERLVDELANAIRAERGLAPVGQAVGA